ncbi:MAG: orotate phosphoribosyltransferase [Bacteroidota bacterium]
MHVAEEVANRLLQINAIKLSPQNPFTWASGILSPIYCDNRIALSYPEVRAVIRKGLVQEANHFSGYDAIAGVATAGIAWGILLAEALGLPYCYVRSKAKAHGRQNLIEGHVEPGSKVLVIEDLISTGGSSLKAVEALREHGCEVVGTLAIFTYGFAKAEKRFADAKCPLRTLSNYEVLLEEAVKTNYIQAADVSMLQEWRSKTGE